MPGGPPFIIILSAGKLMEKQQDARGSLQLTPFRQRRRRRRKGLDNINGRGRGVGETEKKRPDNPTLFVL